MAAKVKNRTGIIIQARTGSTRYPSKVLADLDGKPMLVRVIERLSQVTGIDRIVVATTEKQSDNAVAGLVSEVGGVDLWRGPEDDVLARFCGAAKAFDLDVVGRVTGDCPFIDPDVVSRILNSFQNQEGCDYASNCRPRSWPHGFDVEFVSRSALFLAGEEAADPFDREHVLVYVFTQPDRFKCINVIAEDSSLESLRLTVDYPADIDFARALVDRLGPHWLNLGYEAIKAVIDREPSLLAINGNVPAHETVTGAHQRGQVREYRA